MVPSQIAPVSQPVPTSPPVPNPARSRIFFGVLLALIGVCLKAIGFGSLFLPPSGSQPINSTILRMEIEAAAEAPGIALGGVGLFLIFFTVARVRPTTRPWTAIAGIVMLAVGIAGAALRILSLQIAVDLLSGSPVTEISARFAIVGILQAVVALTGALATIAGIYGLARSWTSG